MGRAGYHPRAIGTKKGSLTIYTVSFTGTRYLRQEHRALIAARIRRSAPPGINHRELRFVTGGCWGVDTVCAEYAQMFYPEACHKLIIPDGPYNQEVELLNFDEIVVMDRGGFRARNQALVNDADKMLAFPLKPEAFTGKGGGGRGGGTWMTIRMARAKMDRQFELTVVVLEPDMARKIPTQKGLVK